MNLPEKDAKFAENYGEPAQVPLDSIGSLLSPSREVLDEMKENFHTTYSIDWHLPEEVLLRVFEFAVESDLDSWGFVVTARSTAPLILTWVCSSWRRLVILSHKFWTSVSLGSCAYGTSLLASTQRFESPSQTRTEGDESILDMFIRRSGTLPLSFALNYDWPEPVRPRTVSADGLESREHAEVAHVEAIASRIIPLRHRWRRLVVNVPDFDALRLFLDPQSFPSYREGDLEDRDVGMPALEELSLSTTHTEFNGPHFALPLKTCKNLKIARIISPMVYFDPSRPHLEFLTTLELHFCHSQLDALAWLSCTPNLEKLLIELYTSASAIRPEPTVESSRGNGGSGIIGARKMCLTQLKRFSFACFYGTSDTGQLLLDSLILPSLKSFSFTRPDLIHPEPLADDTWLNIVHLLLPVGSPSPTLQDLRLIDALSTSEELGDLLVHVGRNLRHVALGGRAVTDALLEDFYLLKMPSVTADLGSNTTATQRDSGPSELLCPKLESLELLDVDVSFSNIVVLASCRASLNSSSISQSVGTYEPTSTPTSASASGSTPDSNVDINDEYSEFRTLKRLYLLDEKFSRFFSTQNPKPSSLFPDGLEVVLI